MMQLEQLKDLVVETLDDMKARDVSVMDVRGKTAVTDYMIVASGTSDRHVKAVAETVAYRAKEAGEQPLGTEGVEDGEWALVDLNGVVLHVMLPKVRDFYNLERLWSAPALVPETMPRQTLAAGRACGAGPPRAGRRRGPLRPHFRAEPDPAGCAAPGIAPAAGR
jgi:ribosome-associated protein